MPFLFHLVGMQTLAWALGVSVTMVLVDSAPGLVRDHPPLAWRLAGLVPGPLALLSLVCFLGTGAPLWVSLALVLPFTLLALRWSWAWYRRTAAVSRRRWGREAMILGLLTLLFTSLELSTGLHSPALALAASAGSAALVGGLGTLLLGAALHPGGDLVAATANPRGIPARAAATGLGITLLAALDTGMNWLLRGGGAFGLPLGLWVGCSLVLPLALLALSRRLYPRWQPSLCATCLGAVLVGQFALQAALYLAS